MHKEFWQQRWQEQRIGFHLNEINPTLINFKLKPTDKILVPLCGKSLDLLYLAKQVTKVSGVEIIAKAVNEFFLDNNLSPTISKDGKFKKFSNNNIEILLGDFFELEQQQVQDNTLIYDRAALVALPFEMRLQYSQIIKSFNIANILLVSLDYPQAEKAGPPFAVTKKEIHALYEDKYSIKLLRQTALDENKNLSFFNESIYLLTICS